jgi:peptidoglycan hydrolase-like protein with peptidoglycan-binding domain
MKKLLAVLIISLISLLGLLPSVVGAAGPRSTGEQAPEQRGLLTKDQIRLAQERLKAEGFDPGPVTGELTPQTETALRQYQEKQSLPVSGALDEATLRELQLSLPPSGTGGR